MKNRMCRGECGEERRYGRGFRYCEDCALRLKKAEKARYYRARKESHPETPEQRRERRLRYRWNLPVEDYEALLAAQGGRCAACRTDKPGERGFHIDHDHECCPAMQSCGRCIRGLLCGPCNRAAGYARDDPTILRALADHIDAHRLRSRGT